MAEDPSPLITEATKIRTEAWGSLEAGYDAVRGIPARLEEIRGLIAAAREQVAQAEAEVNRAYEVHADRARLRELKAKRDRAYWRKYDAENLLASYDVDTEYQRRSLDR